MIPAADPRTPRRWAGAALLALVLHAVWLLPGWQIGAQDSAGPRAGAGAGVALRLASPQAAPPAGAATAAAAPAPVLADDPAEAAGGGGRDGYYAQLRAHLMRHRPAVPPARGSVLLGFRVDGRGQVTRARVLDSSGEPRLDAAARQLLLDAAPLPPPPAGQTLDLSVPVRFED